MDEDARKALAAMPFEDARRRIMDEASGIVRRRDPVAGDFRELRVLADLGVQLDPVDADRRDLWPTSIVAVMGVVIGATLGSLALRLRGEPPTDTAVAWVWVVFAVGGLALMGLGVSAAVSAFRCVVRMRRRRTTGLPAEG